MSTSKETEIPLTRNFTQDNDTRSDNSDNSSQSNRSAGQESPKAKADIKQSQKDDQEEHIISVLSSEEERNTRPSDLESHGKNTREKPKASDSISDSGHSVTETSSSSETVESEDSHIKEEHKRALKRMETLTGKTGSPVLINKKKKKTSLIESARGSLFQTIGLEERSSLSHRLSMVQNVENLKTNNLLRLAKDIDEIDETRREYIEDARLSKVVLNRIKILDSAITVLGLTCIGLSVLEVSSRPSLKSKEGELRKMSLSSILLKWHSIPKERFLSDFDFFALKTHFNIS